MAEAPRILLEHHLKRLKLPTFLREYEKLARQCAAEGLDHVQFLARLVELELIDRERRLVERRIKQAGFPVVKQLESFDFKAIPALNKMLVLDLARGEYIARRENVILLGPSRRRKDPCRSRPRPRRLPEGPRRALRHRSPRTDVHDRVGQCRARTGSGAGGPERPGEHLLPLRPECCSAPNIDP